jgi:ribonucleoside-diphosphate reductase alpha chain
MPLQTDVTNTPSETVPTDPVDREPIIKPLLTTPSITNPLDCVQWSRRMVKIPGTKLSDELEFPTTWSDIACQVAADKYLRVVNGKKERSWKEAVTRVVSTITSHGWKTGYYRDEYEFQAHYSELVHLICNQMMIFNSPVWFNVGVHDDPTPSACYITHIEDSMEWIMESARVQAKIFKGGSGNGTNYSSLRGSNEPLSIGGTSSGPGPFIAALDAIGGSVKSGGATRRAASMMILDVDHPDIETFINEKAVAEKAAHALIDAGFSADFRDPRGGYGLVSNQNANHSVRVTNAFMTAATADEDGFRNWDLKNRLDGRVCKTVDASSILDKISAAAHVCGDPGMQFDDVIQKWHTLKTTGRINASNPCSEFMHLDNTSCNLAALNLSKFFSAQDRELDWDIFLHAVDVTILAMEILVDLASFPTPDITDMTKRTRPLGLGFSNLGGALMRLGIAYVSDEARDMAAAITSMMTARAYTTSARIASFKGPFDLFEENRESMLDVISQHSEAWSKTVRHSRPSWERAMIQRQWELALSLGLDHGYRNSQATVLAPNGTTGLVMDCETTGIEPALALISYKTLVGGGSLKLVNTSIDPALCQLGYSDAARERIVNCIESTGDVSDAISVGLAPEDLVVFDTAFPSRPGGRSIHWRGHISMMAAVQPFLSGAISKTVCVPADTTPDEIRDIYVTAWALGLKSVAVYRDGSKRTQPLNTAPTDDGGRAVSNRLESENEPSHSPESVPRRHRLPATRAGMTHKFSIGASEGYITTGTYPDGRLGELFVRMAKEGGALGALLDAVATAVSIGLQHGIPLETFADKFIGTRFEPSGFTGAEEIRSASSPLDYIFRYLSSCDEGRAKNMDDGQFNRDWIRPGSQLPLGPPCSNCGGSTQRAGTCYTCMECGTTTGCG